MLKYVKWIFIYIYLIILKFYASTRVVKNYLTPIWSRVLALLELLGTALEHKSSQRYGMSLAIWDHTVLPATRHKWTRPALTPAQGRLSLSTNGDKCAMVNFGAEWTKSLILNFNIQKCEFCAQI